MKNITLFILALVVAVGVARAEDLLDAVLNTPSAAAKTNTAPAAVPAVDAPTDPANTAKPTTAESVRTFFSERHPGGNELANSDHMENPMTLSLRGGGSADGMIMDVEYRLPFGEYPFDLSIRGFVAQVNLDGVMSYKELTYAYWYNYYKQVDVFWEEEQRDIGIDALLLWVLWRGKTFEPFVGGGIRYETVKDPFKWTSNGEFLGSGTYNEEESKACLAGRLGLKVNLGKVFITGEYRVGSKIGDYSGTSELIGDIGFFLARRTMIHFFFESLKMDLDKATVFGGGLSFDF